MGGTSVVFSLLEGEMSQIWYQNDHNILTLLINKPQSFPFRVAKEI